MLRPGQRPATPGQAVEDAETGHTGGVESCCDPRGCDRMFTPRFAKRTAERYRRHGLDGASERVVEFAQERGIDAATVLEIGGGVGEIQLELLKRGASQAVNLELAPAYDAEARRLAEDAGLSDRIQRRIHDIATEPAGVQPADVVVLHRVVCCYPDYRRLLVAAADHARRVVVFSYPRRNVASRALMSMLNAALRLQRRRYRGFTHQPEAMLAVLELRGLRVANAHAGLIWQVAVLER